MWTFAGVARLGVRRLDAAFWSLNISAIVASQVIPERSEESRFGVHQNSNPRFLYHPPPGRSPKAALSRLELSREAEVVQRSDSINLSFDLYHPPP